MSIEAFKYALLNTARIRKHLTAYEDTHNREHLEDLAHNFHLQDDPRGDILDRHLQRGRNPEESYLGHRVMLSGQDYYDTHYVTMPMTSADSKERANNFITISPVSTVPGNEKADSVHALFNYKSGNKHYVFQGLFKPHEARNLANKLAPGDRQEVHRILDRHFGK